MHGSKISLVDISAISADFCMKFYMAVSEVNVHLSNQVLLKSVLF